MSTAPVPPYHPIPPKSNPTNEFQFNNPCLNPNNPSHTNLTLDIEFQVYSTCPTPTNPSHLCLTLSEAFQVYSPSLYMEFSL